VLSVYLLDHLLSALLQLTWYLLALKDCTVLTAITSYLAASHLFYFLSFPFDIRVPFRSILLNDINIGIDIDMGN
jgi:hypothetical protein